MNEKELETIDINDNEEKREGRISRSAPGTVRGIPWEINRHGSRETFFSNQNDNNEFMDELKRFIKEFFKPPDEPNKKRVSTYLNRQTCGFILIVAIFIINIIVFSYAISWNTYFNEQQDNIENALLLLPKSVKLLEDTKKKISILISIGNQLNNKTEQLIEFGTGFQENLNQCIHTGNRVAGVCNNTLNMCSSAVGTCEGAAETCEETAENCSNSNNTP